MDEETRAGFEDMRRGFAAINARFDQVDARFDAVDARFDQVDARFAGVDARLGGVDARLGGVDARLGGVDARLGGVDARLDAVDARLDEANQGTAAISQRVDTLEERFMREIRQLGVITEDLRAQIQLVAEGVVGNGRAIERLRGEMNERFRENEVIVGGVFRQIRRDLDELRER
jgi:archaellum component FlaC